MEIGIGVPFYFRDLNSDQKLFEEIISYMIKYPQKAEHL